MPSSIDKVFLDTGAFIALAARTDKHHSEAVATYRLMLESSVQLYTTNHIVDETCTWLLRDKTMGHGAAMKFGVFIRDISAPATISEIAGALPESRRIILVYSSPEVERLAWDIFEKYDTSGFTFTDCTSFAVMSMLSIRKALAFDRHFDMMGFSTV